ESAGSAFTVQRNFPRQGILTNTTNPWMTKPRRPAAVPDLPAISTVRLSLSSHPAHFLRGLCLYNDRRWTSNLPRYQNGSSALARVLPVTWPHAGCFCARLG